jgi:hypothetical protein
MPTPTTSSGTGKTLRRRKQRDARKYSQHYQESDIMESYYRSSPTDKISDYEDIWNTTDHSNPSTSSPKNSMVKETSHETMKVQIDECKDKIISPIVIRCSLNKLNKCEQQQQLALINDKLIIKNDKINANEKLSYKEVTSPEFSSFKPLQDIKSLETTPISDDITIGKRPDLLSRVCK